MSSEGELDELDMMSDSDCSIISSTENSCSYSPVIADTQNRKPWQVEFSCHNLQDLKEIQSLVTRKVSDLLGCTQDSAATLLRYFKWNQEKCIESFLETPQSISEAAGIAFNSGSDIGTTLLKSVEGFSCDICCNDDPQLQSLALACQHRFCVDCYKEYLTRKIMEEGESRHIQCPGDCSLIVNESVLALIVDEDVLTKYKQLLLRTFVEDQNYIKWCPAPNCDFAIECKVSRNKLKEIVPTVKCNCGLSFCFGCYLPDHAPCICSLVKLWLKKCSDDSETFNWMAAHTKECPKCCYPTEKNGGCNHMTCKKCRYEYCWVCMGPWTSHGQSYYNCNRYEDKDAIEARDAQAKSRADLERYLHYYNRYANHEQSAKLDKELYEKTEKKMEQMQRTSEMSWIEVQYLRKAVQVLLESRQTLQWTYAFAYYLTRNNATELFEDNQRDLEMSVEMLSEMLEKPLDPSTLIETKQFILDKSVYVASRREVVLNDTIKGLSESRWSFNVAI